MDAVHLAFWGLIPARAGSTSEELMRQIAERAHPRPCGEHPLQVELQGLFLGSSPPVRGALLERPAPGDSRGLIPARAGSTVESARRRYYQRAHPRPCGEHNPRQQAFYRPEGSSPPVRGARTGPEKGSGWPGLIPARAGSTLLRMHSMPPDWAHPRPCGEHSPPGFRRWG